MAEFETDVDYYEDDENAEDREDTSSTNKIANLFQLVLLLLLYCYVFIMTVLRYVYPASLGPLLQHWVGEVTPQPERNASNVEAIKLAKSLLFDGVLLLLFVAQHTLMAHCNIKKFLVRYNMAFYTRTLYVFCTCVISDLVYQLWQPLPDYQLWHFSSEHTMTLVILMIVHTACWLIIACSLFSIDYLELIGIKQIYYSYKLFYDPLAYKSTEQRELFKHMRHPIFVAPCIILWLVPTMTYDRFLVACLLPLYLGWGSRLSYMDVDYVNYQHYQKSLHFTDRKVN